MSWLCTTSDCSKGEDCVAGMDAVFQSLPANLQNHFQAAHDSIIAGLNTHWTSIDSYVPFNPACCDIIALGVQADQLTQQMQAAAGQAVTTGTCLAAQQGSGGGLLDLIGSPTQIGGLAVIALVGAYLYLRKA